ncbi:2,3-bisphosphoglycerate-dependent phosphoglycerate mutase [subsurface metagenome]
MATLVLLRHFKSQWNLENRFTGWVDVPLCLEGENQVKDVAQKISAYNIDSVYTSPLIRNQDSVLKVLSYIGEEYPIFIHFAGRMKKWAKFAELNKNYVPVYISEALNERHYGKLQGLNKAETMKKYGQDKVHQWRRSFKQRPPGGETLKDVFNRAIPFYKKYVEKDLKQEKNILMVVSHNSARALIKYIEKIADKDIIKLEVPYGGLIVYDFDKSLNLKSKKSL